LLYGFACGDGFATLLPQRKLKCPEGVRYRQYCKRLSVWMTDFTPHQHAFMVVVGLAESAAG
jgi:hypothetical protein